MKKWIFLQFSLVTIHIGTLAGKLAYKNKFLCDIFYPVSQKAFHWSCKAQDYAGNNGPWTKIKNNETNA